MAQLSAVPVAQLVAMTTANAPVSGALATYYVAGTVTKVSLFADHLGATPLANPVTADSYGRFQTVFMTPGTLYDLLVTTGPGAALDGYPLSNLQAPPISSQNTAVQGTAGEAITAGQAVYLSDGSGGKTAGLWYLASANNPYSSTQTEVGIAPDAIASLAVGTINKAGLVTGLSGLTVGAAYYLSGTSGAITTTAPANARYMGQADTTTSLVLDPSPISVSIDNTICDGRLTLTTAVPVTSADVTAATTVFFTPYKGNRIALYSGGWQQVTFTEKSIALGTDTADKNYDVFGYLSSGTLAIERLVWTSNTARATGLTTQDGVLVKSGDATRRYLGTYRTTSAAGQCEDSLAKRFVWNYAQRVPRALRRIDGTASWTYNTATYRQARATAANQVEVVVGWDEVPISLALTSVVTATNGDSQSSVAIGEDSTTTRVSGCVNVLSAPSVAAAGASVPLSARLEKMPAVGYHAYVWLEESGDGAGATWSGSGTFVVSGLSGSIPG